MSRLIFVLTLALPAPATAAVWAFGGAAGNFASVTATVPGSATLVAEARRFDASLEPTALTNISQLTPFYGTCCALTVNRSLPGIGITGGASGTQIDTNQPDQREAMLISANELIRLDGLRLSYVDDNDTLQIYGVKRNGSLVSLGFGGDIFTGLGGSAAVTNTSANNGTTALTFLNTQLAFYSKYVFTTRVRGDVNYGGGFGQGYRIDNIVAEVLPEPGSWMLMITGFGLVGGMMRRDRQQRAALA